MQGETQGDQVSPSANADAPEFELAGRSSASIPFISVQLTLSNQDFPVLFLLNLRLIADIGVTV